MRGCVHTSIYINNYSYILITDINECVEPLVSCPQVCINSIGTYQCLNVGFDGFSLGECTLHESTKQHLELSKFEMLFC